MVGGSHTEQSRTRPVCVTNLIACQLSIFHSPTLIPEVLFYRIKNSNWIYYLPSEKAHPGVKVSPRCSKTGSLSRSVSYSVRSVPVPESGPVEGT